MRKDGFTLIELSIVIAIIAILAAIAVPNYIRYVEKARVAQAIAEIKMLEKVIMLYMTDPQKGDGDLPDSLADLGYGGFLDPWGSPYQYLRIRGGNAKKGKMRKDRFLVPVNTDFDLYSKGKDGKSATPFTSKLSRDDIVRANDGAFLGFAADY